MIQARTFLLEHTLSQDWERGTGGEGCVAIYEVFQQGREGDPMTHVGSLNAPDDELALQYARDVFSRRYEALRLWVVPRASVQQIDDLDLLRPPFDRSHRRPDGYNVVPKLRAIKARVAGTKEEAEVSP